MSRDKQSRAPHRRLQIRVSVDEHMGDFFAWLEGLPATLRGRELVSLARLGRGLNAVGGAVAALLPAGGVVPVGATAAVNTALPSAAHAAPAAAFSVDLSEHAAELATSTFDASFLMAAPSLQ